MMNGEEEKRLREVKRFLELDFSKSSDLQNIVDLAAQLCEKPVALITLLDEKFNWLKVKTGTDIEVMPRETSFCQYGIEQDNLLIIPDATKDQRFTDNPLVHADPHLKFYAGAPLVLNNGLKLGTLCLFDIKSSEMTDVQKKILPILAKQVTFIMELEMSHLKLQEQVKQTEEKNNALMKIAQLQSHQIRQPLTAIMGLINLVKDNYQDINQEWLSMFEIAIGNFDKTIYGIISETIASKDLRSIRFNKMVEEIDDYAILLLDDIGTVENWNKGAEKIKGYKSDEILGRNFSVFYTEEDIKNNRSKELIKEAEKVGVARDEGWRVRKDGTKFWGSIVITAIHNDLGKVIGFTKVTRDLTAIKNAQDAQLFSNDMYKQVLEQTGKLARIGGWEFDLVNNKLSWTSITKEIHGVDEDYIPEIDEAINFYKPGTCRIKISRAVKLAIEEGTRWDLKLKIVNAQGKEICIHTVGASNYRDGICTRVYGTVQDINQR
jgi:PAS domain S-box-containing protein